MPGRKFDLGSDIFDRSPIYQASRTEAEVAFTNKLDNHSTRNIQLGEPLKIFKSQKYISKEQAHKLQDAQAEKLTSLRANKLAS